jgi:hypothetical protein
MAARMGMVQRDEGVDGTFSLSIKLPRSALEEWTQKRLTMLRVGGWLISMAEVGMLDIDREEEET